MSAAEFVLEGLHAHKKIGRSEERVFSAGEKPPKISEKPMFERKSRGLGEREVLISGQPSAIRSDKLPAMLSDRTLRNRLKLRAE